MIADLFRRASAPAPLPMPPRAPVRTPAPHDLDTPMSLADHGRRLAQLEHDLDQHDEVARG